MFSLSNKLVSCVTTCTISVAFVSVIYQAYLESNHLSRLTNIVSGLLVLENADDLPFRTDMPRVAVGYGSCLDIYVNAQSFLNYSRIDQNSDNNDAMLDVITNENELLLSFGHYFAKGAAAERYTSNTSLFNDILRTVQSKTNRRKLGGNAAMMGMRFYTEGSEVLIATRMTTALQDTLPKAIRISGTPTRTDDTHIIFEYQTNECWGPHTAPRANRYILHNDANNPTLKFAETFDEPLLRFNPRLFVISGLQIMDSFPFPPQIREIRLAKIRGQMSSLSAESLVHFEMASFVELAFVQQLLKYVIPFADSIGMNEQELDNLAYFLQHNRISYASESNPRIAISLDKMRVVFRQLRERDQRNTAEDPNSRQISRIHLHTLAYQAILVARSSQWLYTKNAAAKASLTAYRTVCGSSTVNPEAATLIMDGSFATSASPHRNVPETRLTLDPLDPVSCWDESIAVNGKQVHVDICVAPVLVCKVAKQTAGAGDNISASGLSLQI